MVDISKPDGAVTVISAVNPDPETSKLCSVEADPSQVLKAVSEPDVVITELVH